MFIRKPGVAAVLALVVLAAVVIAPASAWTIDGDTYEVRYDHPLTSAAGVGTLTNYQVQFTLSNATGDPTGSTIYTDGTTAADWSDIRFTDTSDTVLPHWIQSTTATTANVFVKIASITEAGSTIRIYYDSDTAAQTSTDDAMIMGDNFDDGAIDPEWDIAGLSSATESGGNLVTTGASNTYDFNTWSSSAIQSVSVSGNFDLVASWTVNSATNSQVKQFLYPAKTGGAVGYIGFQDTHTAATTKIVASTGYDSGFLSEPMTRTFRVTRVGSTVTLYEGATSRGTATDTSTVAGVYLTNLEPLLAVYTGHTATYDYVYMRNLASTEPAHGSYTLASVISAAFSADVTSGTAPLTVVFTDASAGNPTAWAWDFDNDGTTDSTDQNPTHEYTTPGTYTVNLTVTNDGGSDTETKADYITAEYAVPVAVFSANVTSGYTPLAVALTDASTGPPVEWAWTVTGPGGYYDIDLNQNPVMTFTAPGTYTVNLTVTNPAGTDSEVKTNYITVLALPDAPVASFTADTTSGHAPLTVQFTDTSTGSPASWAWDFDGDAVADSTDQNPTHEYAVNGTYTVTLQVSNAGGTDLETKTGYIYVGELTARLLRASFSYSTPIGTAPFSVSFTDTSASNGTYARVWDFGDGATSTEPAPVHEYATAGKYDVDLVITSDYTQDKSAARKAVMAYPAAAVSPLPTTTFGAHMTEIMESNWNVSVIGPIIPRAYTDALTPLAGDTGVGNMIFWGIIWVGVFMILFLRQGTPWLAALVGLVAGPGILTFLPPEWAHVGYICLAVTIGCSFFVIALGRFRST